MYILRVLGLSRRFKISNYVVLLCCLFYPTVSRPISQGPTVLATAFSPMIAMGITLALPQSIRDSCALAVFAFLASMGTYKYLYQFTAEGKIERAERLVQEVASFDLICADHGDIPKITNIIKELYPITKRPLIAAHHLLTYYKSKLDTAHVLANDAEIERNRLFIRTQSIKKRCIALKESIENICNIITASTEYAVQQKDGEAEERKLFDDIIHRRMTFFVTKKTESIQRPPYFK